MPNKTSKTHLYSVKNSKPVTVIDLDALSVLTENNSDFFPSAPEDEYDYVYSIFECFNPDNNLKYYLYSIKILYNNKTYEEEFDFVLKAKEFYLWSFNANLELTFGRHDVDVLDYKEINYLGKYGEWLNNKSDQPK